MWDLSEPVKSVLFLPRVSKPHSQYNITSNITNENRPHIEISIQSSYVSVRKIMPRRLEYHKITCPSRLHEIFIS